MVVGYKVGGLTFFLSKFLMTVTHITLITFPGREAVPEFPARRLHAAKSGGCGGAAVCGANARAPGGCDTEFGRMLGGMTKRLPAPQRAPCWNRGPLDQSAALWPAGGRHEEPGAPANRGRIRAQIASTSVNLGQRSPNAKAVEQREQVSKITSGRSGS